MDRFEPTRRTLAFLLIVLISAGWLAPLAAAISLLHALLFTPHLTNVASYDLLKMSFHMAWLALWWAVLPAIGWSIAGAYKVARHPMHRVSLTRAALPPLPAVASKAAASKTPLKRKTPVKRRKRDKTWRGKVIDD